jgi:hypothetical protein
MLRTPAVLLAVALAGPSALAQDAEIQRELIRRDQQTDAFSLELRQSQERSRIAPGDLRRRGEVEAYQLRERQRLEGINQRQLLEAGGATAPELRPYERMKAERERRTLLAPAEPVPTGAGREDIDRVRGPQPPTQTNAPY